MHESGMGNMVPGEQHFTQGYVKKDQDACTSTKIRDGLVIWIG